MASTPVSPKVVASSVSGAVTVIVMYLLGLIPFVASWPDPVRVALLVVVTAAVTWVGGYLTRDPLRHGGVVPPTTGGGL